MAGDYVARNEVAGDYVKAASATIRLEISPDNEAGVVENFERIASIADFLMQFPLAQETEVAPVFRP
jgi:hypothetical protein